MKKLLEPRYDLSVLVLTLFAGGGLVVAQPDGSGSDNTVHCSQLPWTDCAGTRTSMTWTCPSGTACCKTVWKSPGPDGEKGTDDDCIIDIQPSCGTAPCTDTQWVL